MTDGRDRRPPLRGFSVFLWRLATWIAPPEARGRFRREWTAELAHHAETQGARASSSDAILRAALADAWWLRRHRGADAPPLSSRLLDAGPLSSDSANDSASWAVASAAGPGALLNRIALLLRVCRRRLSRAPLFSALFVALLGGGIAAAATVYTVAHRVLVAPLDYHEPDRLVRLLLRDPDGKLDWASWAQLERLDSGGAFESVAASTTFPGVWRAPEGLERIQRSFVSPGYFETLGVSAARGALLDRESTDQEVVLAHRFWVRHFGADDDVVGRAIEVDGGPRVVVGVAPPELYGHDLGNGAPQLYRVQPAGRVERNPHTRLYTLFARLRDGQTPELAAAELQRVTRSLAVEHPDVYGGWSPEVERLLGSLLNGADRSLALLLAAVVALLLIVALNLAGLTASRALSRARESALHLALGAGRGSAAAHALIEGLVLSLLGGLAGTLLTAVVLRSVVRLDPTLPRWGEIVWGPPTLIFAALATVGASLVVLAATASLSRTRQPFLALRVGVRSQGSRRAVLRSLVISTQVALSVPLVLGALLLVRSLLEVGDRDLGLDVADVHALRISRPPERAREPVENARWFEQLRERLGALPGALAVGAGLYAPLVTEEADRTRFRVEGGRDLPEDEAPRALLQVASVGFFDALGSRIVDGRDFEPRDRLESAPVAVVNEELVRRVFPGSSPLGKRLEIELALIPGDPPVREVVGVVEDQAQLGPLAEIEPMIFVPHGQTPWPSMAVVVRSALDLETLQPTLRAAVAELDPEAIVDPAVTLTAALESSLAAPRGLSRLLLAFAVAAVAVSALGLYAALSQQVVERRREIGLRMAMGATQGAVAGLFLRRGVLLTLGGLAAGSLMAFALRRVLASQLHGSSVWDPIAVSATVVVLALTGVLASWMPARRAARHDPRAALQLDDA